MKNSLLILSLLISISGYSQMSISPSHYKKSEDFKKTDLERFRKTKTIFVFNNVISKKAYEEVLAKSWNITPYEIIDEKSFNVVDYIKSETDYSFVSIEGYSTTNNNFNIINGIYIYLNVKMFDKEKVLKKLSKVKGENATKIKNIIIANDIDFARVMLFPTVAFLKDALSNDEDIIVDNMFNKDSFYNLQPGYLKNYLQTINLALKNGEKLWLYENVYMPNLKNLNSKTLYIPSYINDFYQEGVEIKGNKIIKGEKTVDDFVKNLFSNYEYKHEFINTHDLNKKILEGQDLYYFRYTVVGNFKFVQVVNARTSEIVYRDNIHLAPSFKLNEKDVKKLNATIKKASKKSK